MPRTQQILSDLSRGEVTPKLRGRVESDQYPTMLETLENCLVEKRGGVFKRPGTHFVAPTKFPDQQVRLVPFVFSNSQSYVMEFGDRYVRFYRDSGQVVEQGAVSIYIGDGTSTRFIFPYPDVDPADIEVLDVNGVVVPPAAYTVTPVDTNLNYAPAFNATWNLDLTGNGVPWTLAGTAATAPQDEETQLGLEDIQLPLGGTYHFTVDVSNVDHYSKTINVTDATDVPLTSGAPMVEIASVVSGENVPGGSIFNYQFTAEDTSGTRTSDFTWEFRQNGNVEHAGSGTYGAAELVSINGITIQNINAGDTFSLWVQATGNHPQSVPQVSGSINPTIINSSYVVDADAKLEFGLETADSELTNWTEVVTENGTQVIFNTSETLTEPSPMTFKFRARYGVTATLDNPVFNVTTPGHILELISQFDVTDTANVDLEDANPNLPTPADYVKVAEATVADATLTGFSIPVEYGFLMQDMGAGTESIFDWQLRQNDTVILANSRQTDQWQVDGILTSQPLTGSDTFSIWVKATFVDADNSDPQVRGADYASYLKHNNAPSQGTVIIIRDGTATFQSEGVRHRSLLGPGEAAPQQAAGDVFEIQSPFESDELDELYWVQANDQMWFCHYAHKPWLLTRWGANDWRWSQPTYFGAPWEEGDYSPLNGYPRVVTFFQERLVFAATLAKPQTLWLSRSADFYDFRVPKGDSEDPITPDSPLEYTLAAYTQEAIQAMSSERVLLIFTSATEHRLSPDQFLSADRLPTISKMTDFGAAHIMPVHMGDLTAFVQFNGNQFRSFQQKSNTVIELYESLDLGWMSEHMFAPGLKEPGYALVPNALAYMIRLDGQVLTATYDPTTNAYEDTAKIGWSRQVTQGAFQSITSIPEGPEDQIWSVATREISGAVAQYVEYWDDRYRVDSCLDYVSSTDDPPVTSVGGLSHLEGRVVSIVTDRGVHPDQTVVNGEVNLTWPANTIAIGLGYTSRLVTMPFEEGNPSGTAQGKPKRWANVWVSLFESPNPKINGKRPPSRTPTDPQGSFPPFETQAIKAHNLGIDRDGKISIEQDLPVKCHVLALYGDFMLGQG